MRCEDAKRVSDNEMGQSVRVGKQSKRNDNDGERRAGRGGEGREKRRGKEAERCGVVWCGGCVEEVLKETRRK